MYNILSMDLAMRIILHCFLAHRINFLDLKALQKYINFTLKIAHGKLRSFFLCIHKIFVFPHAQDE